MCAGSAHLARASSSRAPRHPIWGRMFPTGRHARVRSTARRASIRGLRRQACMCAGLRGSAACSGQKNTAKAQAMAQQIKIQSSALRRSAASGQKFQTVRACEALRSDARLSCLITECLDTRQCVIRTLSYPAVVTSHGLAYGRIRSLKAIPRSDAWDQGREDEVIRWALVPASSSEQSPCHE